MTFAIKAHRKWPGMHLYVDTRYVDCRNKCEIYCLTHNGYAVVEPNGLLCWVTHNGCPECGRLIRKNKLSILGKANKNTMAIFLQQAKAVHGDKYDYSLVIYVNQMTHVMIICKACARRFRQRPKFHIVYRNRCPSCANRKWNNKHFITKAVKRYGDKLFDYSAVICNGVSNPVIITCKLHNFTFNQTPKSHIDGHVACYKCQIRGASLISKGWLDLMFQKYNNGTAKIESKFTTGTEYRIPDTRYRADGFITYSDNTEPILLEFHGTYWHGDPQFYAPNWYMVGTRTFGEAYQSTVNKEKIIADRGYRYVRIWENTWRKFLSVVVKLQKVYRLYRSYKLLDPTDKENRKENLNTRLEIYHQVNVIDEKLHAGALTAARKHANQPIIISEDEYEIFDSDMFKDKPIVPDQLHASEIPGDTLEEL